MKNERLFAKQTIHGWSLRDSTDHHIAWFETFEDCKKWCAENGYAITQN